MNSIEYLNNNFYIPNNINIKDIENEIQNSKYGGCRFNIGDIRIRMRDGNITPKKIGFFTAFWEKDGENKNQPYSIDDSTDLLIINTFDGDRKGQFVFDKEILKRKGVYSFENKKGKMSMRLYSDWCEVYSQEAIKSKTWQGNYFINFNNVTLDRQKLFYKIS